MAHMSLALLQRGGGRDLHQLVEDGIGAHVLHAQCKLERGDCLLDVPRLTPDIRHQRRAAVAWLGVRVRM
eukprot:scaffold114536_cov60-Phaeocystis_antarctica.AAC.6